MAYRPIPAQVGDYGIMMLAEGSLSGRIRASLRAALLVLWLGKPEGCVAMEVMSS